MGVESVIRDEVQGNRAMGQDDFARFGIDPGRIRLESGISGRREGDRHGQEGRDIPFAACGNPFRVEVVRKRLRRFFRSGLRGSGRRPARRP